VPGLSLLLRGDQLDPGKVTSLLGVEPSSTRTRGERRELSGGRWTTQRTGVWSLKVEAGSPSESVAALAARFGGQLPDLSSVPGVDEAFLDVFVTFELGKDPGTEVTLHWEPADLAQLAACRLPLVITFAVVGADRALLTEPPTDESVLF
jgi:hypothetical protein